MKLSSNKNIEQVCVVGEGIPQPIALITLSDIGEAKNTDDLARSLKSTKDLVNSELNQHEKLNNIIVLFDEWTVENKLLTPTMKIKRNSLEKIYKKNYSLWYDGDNIIIDSDQES